MDTIIDAVILYTVENGILTWFDFSPHDSFLDCTYRVHTQHCNDCLIGLRESDVYPEPFAATNKQLIVARDAT